MALIVSHALPKDLQTFDHMDGSLGDRAALCVPVAIACGSRLLRCGRPGLRERDSRPRWNSMYQYLTGPRFKHRIEAIVERFIDMQADLERERRSITKQCRPSAMSRSDRVMEATAGMYGDLQGIAGKAIEEIEILAMPLLENKPADNDDGNSRAA